MIVRLVPDPGKLKIARRYAVAANTLMTLLGTDTVPEELPDKFPKGPNKKAFDSARAVFLEMQQKAHKEGIVPPPDDHCRNLPACLKMLQRRFKKAVEVDSNVVETVEHKGFTIEVHELLDQPDAPCRFVPLILKDGKVARRIFVRSKKPYVSIEHFAKRAIDHFLATGEWPAKQGVSLTK